jgi:hypothetical protein
MRWSAPCTLSPVTQAKDTPASEAWSSIASPRFGLAEGDRFRHPRRGAPGHLPGLSARATDILGRRHRVSCRRNRIAIPRRTKSLPARLPHASQPYGRRRNRDADPLGFCWRRRLVRRARGRDRRPRAEQRERAPTAQGKDVVVLKASGPAAACAPSARATLGLSTHLGERPRPASGRGIPSLPGR